MEAHLARLTTILLALALALGALAACGDDGDDSGAGGAEGGDDFVSQVNEACKARSLTVADAAIEKGSPANAKEYVQNVTDVTLPAREELVSTLEGLEPPAEDKADFKKFLALERAYVAQQKKIESLYEQGGDDAVNAAAAKLSEQGDEIQAVAREAGFDVCGLNALSPEEEEAATDVVREFATTADPKTSCEPAGGLVLPVLVESNFGGKEECVKYQKQLNANPEQLPTDIKVTKTEGIDGVSARIYFSDVGGKFAGQPSEATLYYQDGGWRVYSVTLES